MIDIFILSDKVNISISKMRVFQPTPIWAIVWNYFNR